MAMQEVGVSGTETYIIILFSNMAHGCIMKINTLHKVEDTLGDIIGKITQQPMPDDLKEECHLQLIEKERERRRRRRERKSKREINIAHSG